MGNCISNSINELKAKMQSDQPLPTAPNFDLPIPTYSYYLSIPGYDNPFNSDIIQLALHPSVPYPQETVGFDQIMEQELKKCNILKRQKTIDHVVAVINYLRTEGLLHESVGISERLTVRSIVKSAALIDILYTFIDNILKCNVMMVPFIIKTTDNIFVYFNEQIKINEVFPCYRFDILFTLNLLHKAVSKLQIDQDLTYFSNTIVSIQSSL